MPKNTHLIANLTLLLVCCCACKKNQETKHPVDITGTWNWTDTYLGGNPSSAGWHTTPGSTGKTETIIFDNKGVWQHLMDGLIDDSGTFTLGHGRYNPDPKILFIYDSVAFFKDGNKTGSESYSISNDTLAYSPFLRGLVDGGGKIWVRSKR